MTILIASDSFKDGCSSIAACEAIAKGIKSVNANHQIDICPISDGGEGTVEVLQYHLGGTIEEVDVSNPLFKRINAKYLKLKYGTAVIEMAQAAGLELLEVIERNPMNTSTFGVGELLIDAIDKGCKNLILTIGGSATNDLGMGMMSALGYQYHNKSGNILSPIGANMINVSKMLRSNMDLDQITISVLTDVQNILYGPDGAAHVFGRQKGANSEEIEILDKGLQNLASIIESTTKKQISNLQGAGAAGGLGAACVAFLNAKLESGSKKIIELIDLKSKIAEADIVITGEGHLDQQTSKGKIISQITKIAKDQKKPVIVFCGKNSLKTQEAHDLGIHFIIEISDYTSDISLKYHLANTSTNLLNHARTWASQR